MDDERAALWEDAFELWIGSRRSPNTQAIYRKIWMQFALFVRKPAWEVAKSDVARWVNHMQGLQLAPSTINQRVMCLRSFYSYCQEEYEIVQADGARRSLCSNNPAGARSLKLRVPRYENQVFLTAEEARALLGAVDRSTVRGKRDYALLLFYLATGRRNSEVRKLRWGDFEEKGEAVWYRWSGKGKRDQRYRLPRPVWEALREYAQAARLPGNDEDFVFTGLIETANNLPNVSTYQSGRDALSLRMVQLILKRYARKAGLDSNKIHVHSLRHTAAMLRKESGESVDDISKFLAHSSIGITQVYLHELEGKGDEVWNRVGELLGL